MSFSYLYSQLLFGVVGTAFFIYGKRQSDNVFLVAGCGLMVFPYFISGLVLTLLVGAALIASPFLLRRFGA